MDAFKNFAKVTVSTGYDASATSIALTAGHGARLPAAPFNATWWNSTDYPDPTDDPNVEIVRVTAIASDTLTVTRAQESTGASTKNTASKTYKLIAGLTAKTLNTDIGSGTMAQLQVINGRLTLESGVGVSTTDQTAKTTIYFTPFHGNCISLYDGTDWICLPFTERSLALGTLTADKNYDVFIYDNAGTITLELGAAWTSDTARSVALAMQDGVHVKSGAPTRRYLGTIRTTSTTTTEDSLLKRFVWNNDNRIVASMYFTDATSHSYDGVYRQWNNSAASQVAFVAGLAEDGLPTNVNAQCNASGASTFPICGIGFDTGTVPFRKTYTFTVGENLAAAAGTVIPPQIGYHYITVVEGTLSTGATTFSEVHLTALNRC